MSMNGMSNNQLKKQSAEYHNKKRKERLELEEYKRNNLSEPQPRRNRGSMSVPYEHAVRKRKLMHHMGIMSVVAGAIPITNKD